jgi:murein DD-endopeptidase MepM/ murein hydrolase activator NlpD
MSKNILVSIILIAILFSNVNPVIGQTSPDNPVYTVQKGDTLTQIALRFGISVSDLINANNITDPNAITVGTKLAIPGFEGISGDLIPVTISPGEIYKAILLKFQIPEDIFLRLNRITSPDELYIGSTVIVQQMDAAKQLFPKIALGKNSTLLESAVRLNMNPWEIVSKNRFLGTWDGFSGDEVFSPADPAGEKGNSLNPIYSEISISPLPLIQGETTDIKLQSDLHLNFTGSLLNLDLHFFKTGPREYTALQGIPRMTQPGIYPLQLISTSQDGEPLVFEQSILLVSRPRIEDPRLPVDPITMDPKITVPEDLLIKGIVTQISQEKLWDGLFVPPVDVPKGYSLFPDCTTDRYGNLRAYNDGPFDFYHSGLDLSACGNNLNIYAVAPGIVVFSDLLTVRGNYTVIDHGWGIFSGYGHQAEIKVKVGEMVTAGQLIGILGKTGRVTGPHLHWDMFVNGVQIDPLDWINNTYP